VTDNDIMLIAVDISRSIGFSKSGRSVAVGGTYGNRDVWKAGRLTGIKLNLTAHRPPTPFEKASRETVLKPEPRIDLNKAVDAIAHQWARLTPEDQENLLEALKKSVEATAQEDFTLKGKGPDQDVIAPLPMRSLLDGLNI
jgi:hypothetical protein